MFIHCFYLELGDQSACLPFRASQNQTPVHPPGTPQSKVSQITMISRFLRLSGCFVPLLLFLPWLHTHLVLQFAHFELSHSLGEGQGVIQKTVMLVHSAVMHIKVCIPLAAMHAHVEAHKLKYSYSPEVAMMLTHVLTKGYILCYGSLFFHLWCLWGYRGNHTPFCAAYTYLVVLRSEITYNTRNPPWHQESQTAVSRRPRQQSYQVTVNVGPWDLNSGPSLCNTGVLSPHRSIRNSSYWD